MDSKIRKIDRMILDFELEDFIPDKIFDFHCHIFDAGQLAPESIPEHYRRLAYPDKTRLCIFE